MLLQEPGRFQRTKCVSHALKYIYITWKHTEIGKMALGPANGMCIISHKEPGCVDETIRECEADSEKFTKALARL